MPVIASYTPEPIDLEPFIAEARRMIAGGADLEAVWGYLRQQEIWLSDSITVTVEITGVARRNAKRMVCHSQTWSDLFPSIVQLHDDLHQGLTQLAQEDPDTVSYRSGAPAESAS